MNYEFLRLPDPVIRDLADIGIVVINHDGLQAGIQYQWKVW
jgi:hypothetical protein